MLIDTSVWSLALRRKARSHATVDTLRRLIAGGQAAMIGPVRQEVLSGIPESRAFERLRDHLASFPDEPIATADYEQAAAYFNECRARGLQGSDTDFLMCAVCVRHRMALLTTDTDFVRFAEVIPVTLHPYGP